MGTGNFKEEIGKLSEETIKFLSVNGWETKGVSAFMRTAFDGDNELYGEFKRISPVKAAEKRIKFSVLAIDKRTADYKAPLVLLCDDAEPDIDIAGKMRRRNENGYKTFPIVVFPDEFFELAQGEKLSYIDICESVEEYTGARVMPLRRADMYENLHFAAGYVEYIYHALLLENLDKALKAKYDELFERSQRLIIGSSFEQLSALIVKKAFIKACIGIEAARTKCASFVQSWEQALVNLRDNYDRHILETVTRKQYEGLSSMAVRLNLKYNTNGADIITFANKVLEQTADASLIINPRPLCENTIRKLESETSEIAFIGTFSSGKTTLINALLGIPHKLPTSARHNTAVLTYIEKSGKDDNYTIEYGDELIWSIVSLPSYENNNIRNPFKGPARVMSIKRSDKEGYLVTLRELTGEHREYNLKISGAHKLAVEEGSNVDGEKSLIKVLPSDRTAELCTRDELNYLSRVIASGKVKALKLNGKPIDASIFNKLSAALAELYHDKKPDRAVSVSLDTLRKRLDDEFIPCDLSCTFAAIKTTASSLKTDKDWAVLCGDPDKNIRALCEKPECYMTAKKLTLQLNSEFLRFSTLVDTPGFGSVTEQHDNITERFIRDNATNLVVMIKIGKTTEDVKYTDLINNLTSIYKNYKNGQQKNVRFILNCFASSTSREHCERTALKISRDLVDRGFLRENIFACYLKEELFDNSQGNPIAGLGTYKQFREQCLEELPIMAFRDKFRGIKADFESFFKQNLHNLETQIVTAEQQMAEREDSKRDVTQRLNNVKAVTLPNFNTLIDNVKTQFDDIYDSFYSAFVNNKKHGGFLWLGKKRSDALGEVFKDQVEGQLKLWSEDEDNLVDEFEYAMNELISVSGDVVEFDTPKKPRQHLIVLSNDAISKILDAANDGVGIFKKSSKTAYHMEKLEKQIKTDFNTSKKHITEYGTELKRMFDSTKQTLIDQLKSRLNALQSEKTILDEIHRLESTRGTLNELRYEFGKLNFTV